MHSDDSLSLVIIALSHVFTLRRVLNVLSMLQVVGGKATAIRNAFSTAGKNASLVSVRSSVRHIEREGNGSATGAGRVALFS